ncbi:HAMP domain-containing histidine kinase [Sporolactobacillus sp. THM7-7]|nr:HAMP domain-containing histidine kinase [Sporolactobacillus sp. THM7-7]
MEMRFCLTPEGRILDCNRNGKVMVDRYGDSFFDFFPKSSALEVKRYLKAVTESDDVVTVLLNDQIHDNGVGTLYNGRSKNEKIYLTGYHTAVIARLAAEFAHELRNPLAVIKGFVQLSGYTQEFDKYQRTILSEIDRMHAILENFLSLSKKKIKMEKMLPDRVCASLISFVSSECILKKVSFDYDVALSEMPCNVDLSMIKQVILNLLRNALEAFTEGQKEKRVFFRGMVEEKGYRFSLTDNGPGIEAHMLRQLDKPFFTTKENGTGIGLSLCKKIVSEHHGTFCLSSVPGKGTTVSFLLPFASVSESHAPKSD